MESKELVFGLVHSDYFPSSLPLGKSWDVNSFVFETEIKFVGFEAGILAANCICMCVYSGIYMYI